MPDKNKQLVQSASDVIKCTERLRDVLLRFKKGVSGLAGRVEEGELAVAALGAIGGPIRRQELTETLAEFEAARHQLRLAVFALALEQGTSTSEVGRMLAISRQLASRLAIEAERGGI